MNINKRYIISELIFYTKILLLGVQIMNKNKIVIILIVILTLTLSLMLAGCSDYGYSFHYRVVGGNGKIATEKTSFDESSLLCKDAFCELGCPEESRVFHLRGGKNGSRTVTFIAIPDEGYQVKAWLYNGKVVEGNKTNTYTAIVTSEDNYNGVIEVVFEKI